MNFFKRLLCICLCALSFLTMTGGVPVEADGIAKTKTISLSGTSQSQSQAVTIPDLGTVTGLSVNCGTASYTRNGDTVNVMCSGGTGQSQSTGYYTQEWVCTSYTTFKIGPEPTYDSYSSYTPGCTSYEGWTMSGYSGASYSYALESVWVSTGTTTYYSYSVTITYTVDNTPPSITLTSSGNTVPFTVTANISDTQSGIAIQKWASGNQSTAYFDSAGAAFTGSTISGLSAGTYTVYAKDNAGNAAVKTIVLTTDTTPPNGSGIVTNGSWTNGNVTIHFTATDTGSGVASITTPDGKVVNAVSTDFTVSSNGTYSFTVTDKAGNKKTVPVTVSNIDKTPPSGNYTLSKTKWTCGNVTIYFSGTDDASGVAGIITPDGRTICGGRAEFTATDNGTYNFTVEDNAGNKATVPVTISNIDRQVSVTHPIATDYTIDPNAETLTGNDISITNNSQHIGVSVSVAGLSSTGIDNVTPGSVPDWRALTAEQTAGSMSLGVKVNETAASPGGWNQIAETSPVYTAGIETPVKLGVLDVGGTGNLSFCANYGLAWAKRTTVQQRLSLVFNCEDVE